MPPINLDPHARRAEILAFIRRNVMAQMARPIGLRMAMREQVLAGAERLHDHGYEAWSNGFTAYGQVLIDAAQRMEAEATHV